MPPRAKSARTKAAEDVHTTKMTDKELESPAVLKHKAPSAHAEGDLKEDTKDLPRVHADGLSHAHVHAHGPAGNEAGELKSTRHRFFIDYSARNVRCNGCYEMVSVNRMRVCHISPPPAQTHSYFHGTCLLPNLRAELVTTYGEPAYIEGFDAMAAHDQKAFLESFTVQNPLLDAAVAAAAAAAGPAAGAAAGHAAEHAAGHAVGSDGAPATAPARVDVQPANQLTVCTDCLEYVAAGEPRVGILVHRNHKYRHVGCLYRGAAQLLLREAGSWEGLEGLAKLPSDMRAQVLTELNNKVNS